MEGEVSRTIPQRVHDRTAELAQMSTPALAKKVASLYDEGRSYLAEWRELVKRVGVEEAETLVDMA